MNWGKSIILVFVLFAGFIGTMVYRMTRQRVDLVSENYYQNEIDFQQHIDRVANARRGPSYGGVARRVHAGPDSLAPITYQSDQQQVVFVLPVTLKKGEIKFYRPGDREKDFRITIPADHPTRQVVPTKSLAKGNWRVQFTWSDGQLEYYTEERIFL